MKEDRECENAEKGEGRDVDFEKRRGEEISGGLS
jgi:hypothetical protein